MAYEIIGTVHLIGATVSVPTKSGQSFQRRSLTLVQRRFDQNTGEEFDPNYPTIDFTQRGCSELDRFKPGDRVRVRFDISSVKYQDKNTHEEKYFTSLRGFRIEPYVVQQRAAYAAPQQAVSSPRPSSQYQQPYPPQAVAAMPSSVSQPPVGDDPFAPQHGDGLPF